MSMKPSIDRLFSNPGEKIKVFSKWLFIISIIVDVLGGLVTLIVGLTYLFDDFETGAYIMLGGIVAICMAVPIAWVISLFIYAFGALVESNETLVAYNRKSTTVPAPAQASTPMPAPPASPSKASAPVQAAPKASPTNNIPVKDTPVQVTPVKEDPAPTAPAPKTPAPIVSAEPKPPVPTLSPLATVLERALRFTTDDGMIHYLRLTSTSRTLPSP